MNAQTDRLSSEVNRSERAHRLVCPNLNSLTQHLMQHFSIPHGHQLALALSPEGRGDNEAALRSWVRREMVRIANGVRVDNLLVALEQRLLDLLLEACPEGGAVDVPSPMARGSRLPLPYWEATDQCIADARQRRTLPAGRSDWRAPDAERAEQHHEKP